MLSSFLLNLSFRTIINLGYLLLSVLMMVVVILDYYDLNNYLIIVMTFFTAIFQAT